MAAEDCATVLEQFIHDVANLPAEITHLMEEIQAKDKIIQEHRATINSRDSSLQKFIKLNGSLTPNPKEEQYSKAILQSLDKCREIQDEKIQLSEKACVLLDRQIKKLDIKIRDLIRDGVLSNDPPLPSLFDNKQQNGQPPKPFFPDNAAAADAVSGAYSPLSATPGNANGAVAAAQRPIPNVSRSASMTQVPSSSQTPVRASAPSTPSAAASHLQQRQRESSAGAVDTKRRRLNTSLSTTGTAPSNLRQSSLGPGTPKASTPVSSSRAGSAGPRTGGGTSKKAVTKKVAPHQQVRKLKSGTVKRSSSVGGHVKKKSPSSVVGADDDEDESALSSADISESDSVSVSRRRRYESDEEFEEEDEAGEDSKVYCTCRSVSHGDMVACDNENCPYEWFHWKCVGLTREPVGSWYCDECRANLGK